MSLLRVRKTRITEAIQITTPDDEKIVRSWLVEWTGQADEIFDLENLKQQHIYFMRDEGSPIVYITASADFLTFFEEVDEEEELGFKF